MSHLLWVWSVGALMTACVIAGAACLVAEDEGRPSVCRSLSHSFCEFVIAASAFIVMVVMASGTLGFLNRRELLLLVAATILAVAMFLRRMAPRHLVREIRLRAGNAIGGVSSVLSSPDSNGTIRWCLCALAVGTSLFLAARFFLPPVSWDALTYHLRYPAHWLLAGRLETLAEPFGDPSPTFYPLNGEMLFYWGLATSGSDLLSVFWQVPFVLASMAAIVELVVFFGGERSSGILASLVWLSVPGLFQQAFEPGVDHMTGAFFLTAVLFGLRAGKTREVRDLLFAAAAAGLLIGTKYIGVVFLLPLAVILLATSSEGGGRKKWKSAVWLGAAGLVVGLGGFSYLRNFVNGGNPLLPMSVNLGPIHLPGFRSSKDYFSGLTLREFLTSPRLLLDWGPVIPPGLVFAFLTLFKAGARRRLLPLSIGAMAFFLSFALLIPYHDARFLFALDALVVIVAAVLSGPGRTWGRLCLAGILINLPIALFYWIKERFLEPVDVRSVVGAILAAILAVLVALVLRPGTLRVKEKSPSRKWGFTVSATLVLMAVLFFVQLEYQKMKYDLWTHHWSHVRELRNRLQKRQDLADMAMAWQLVAGLTRGKPAVVAYSGNNLPYALSGYDLGNKVVFVPRDERVDSWRYDWGSRPGLVTAPGSLADWRRNLETLRIDYLCTFTTVMNGARSEPPEQRMADLCPDRLVKVYEFENVRVYRTTRPVPSIQGAR